MVWRGAVFQTFGTDTNRKAWLTLHIELAPRLANSPIHQLSKAASPVHRPIGLPVHRRTFGLARTALLLAAH